MNYGTAIAREIASAIAIYEGSNGQATMALYARLEQLGPVGIIAVNLFRACKASERAKVYRGGRRGFRSVAYDKKDWSLGNLCEALRGMRAITDAGIDERVMRMLVPGEIKRWPLVWGWGIDDKLRQRDDPHHHVLYIDLPTGQVSFHNGNRYDGPDYSGQWDGMPGQSADRICRWVGRLLAHAQETAHV